jgi:hypothetical protein
MPEVKIYDIAIDEVRSVCQDDIHKYGLLTKAVRLQAPEIREAISATYRELLKKEPPSEETLPPR